MDTAERKVAAQLYGMVAEAYGYRTDSERFVEVPCVVCGGNGGAGCQVCEFTGVEE